MNWAANSDAGVPTYNRKSEFPTWFREPTAPLSDYYFAPRKGHGHHVEHGWMASPVLARWKSDPAERDRRLDIVDAILAGDATPRV